MGCVQDLSKCVCRTPPICPPPDGDNDGDPLPGLFCGFTIGDRGDGGDGGGGEGGFEGGDGNDGHEEIYGIPEAYGSPHLDAITGLMRDDGTFEDINPDLRYYSNTYNVTIQSNSEILKFANVKSSTTFTNFLSLLLIVL